MTTVAGHKTYPFKVWLTWIWTAPIILLLIGLMGEKQNFGSFLFLIYIYMILFGAVISLPVLLLFYFAYKKIETFHLPGNAMKLLLALIAIAAMCIYILIVVGKEAFSLKDLAVGFPVSYALGILLSLWANKLT